MKQGFAEIASGQLHYLVEGKGQPLVLLHQVPSWAKEYSNIMPELGKHFKVIAVDNTGYGVSDPRRSFYQVADYARDVKDFLGALGIKKCHLFGHHTGASIAVEVAAAYPEMVDGMVLSGCPYYTREMRENRLKTGAFAPPQLMADGSHLTTAWNTIKKYTPSATAEMLNEMVIARLLAGQRGEEGHQALLQYDIETRLPMIKCPTLLFSASTDTFVGQIETLSRLIPNCRTRVEPGDGLITYTNPALLVRVILDFFKQA